MTLFSPRHDMERKNITQETQTNRKKAGQENLQSRVAGIQDIADTKKDSVLAGAWHCIYVSREGNF